MKITSKSKDISPPDEIPSYPSLRLNSRGKYVVMFTDLRKGMIVEVLPVDGIRDTLVPAPDRVTVGRIDTNWAHSEDFDIWEPYNKEITIIITP